MRPQLWVFGVVLALGGLALDIALTARSMLQAQASGETEAAHIVTFETLAAAKAMIAAAREVEAATWAYIATSEPAHLARAAAGQATARRQRARLVGLLRTAPDRSPDLDRLVGHVDRTISLHLASLEAAKMGDRRIALARLGRADTERAFADIRHLLMRIERANDRDATQRSTAATEGADEAARLDAMRLLLHLFLLALVALGASLLLRERIRRRETQLKLEASIKLNELERKSRRAEQALIEREAQLALAIEHAPAGVAMFDRDMRFIAASRRFASDYGLAGDAELRGRDFYDVFPETPQRWLNLHRRVIDQGEEISADEDVLRRRDGQMDCLRWSMKPWRTASGCIGGLVLFSEVITSQLEAQRRLAQSAARFRAVFDNAAVGMARVSFGDERVLEMNHALCRMLGYEPADAAWLRWSDITHPDDLGSDIIMLRQLTGGELGGYSVEKRLLHRSGREIWARLTISAVRSPDGAPDFQIWIVEDVGQRRAAERSLRDERDRTRAYLDVVAVMVIAADCDGNIEVINRRGCEILGYADPDELIGRNWYELALPREDGRGLREAIEAFIRSGADTPLPYESVIRRPDGTTRIIAWRNTLLRHDEGTVIGIIASGEDITDVRETEAKLQEMQSELIHSSRLSAMGTMASTMAHELTQPLTAISNFLSTGSELVAVPGEAAADALREALDEAAAQSVRAGDILHHLREFVSKGETDRAPAQLSRIVQEATSLALIGEDQSRVTLTIDIEPEADDLMVDRVQVEQVLVNLIRNAAESMATAPVRELRIAARAHDAESVEITVEDTGPGLANGGDKLFEAFNGTKPTGLGLGLSISKTIVESHGGSLRAENAPGGGALFTFTLPRLVGEAAYE